jgi:hypothetical protein
MPEAASALISLLDNKTALVVLEGSKDDSDKGQDTYKTNELPDTLEELVLNIVGLLNNLSYYGNKEENGIFLRGGDVIRCTYKARCCGQIYIFTHIINPCHRFSRP